MESRWWRGAIVLVFLGSLALPGCDSGAQPLPMSETETNSVDPEADMEVPEP